MLRLLEKKVACKNKGRFSPALLLIKRKTIDHNKHGIESTMNERSGMRQGGSSGARRPRGRHSNNDGRNNGGSSPRNGGDGRHRSASSLRHQTFDSNGPDVRVRGTAWQVYEKYQALARDASSSGDHVMAENYLQHAEHYFRITEAIEEASAAESRQRGGAPYGSQPEMPQTYYTPEGKGVPPVVAAPVQQPMADQPAPPLQDAEVTRRTPPQPPVSALFSDDEESSSNPQSLVAQR